MKAKLKNSSPTWAQHDGTVLGSIEKMKPCIKQLEREMRLGKKAKDAGKPKRVAYHMRRAVNMLFNIHTYFWQPMFEWAQVESFEEQFKRRKKRTKNG